VAKHRIFSANYQHAIRFSLSGKTLSASLLLGDGKSLDGCTLLLGVAGRNSKTVADELLGGAFGKELAKVPACKLSDALDVVSDGDISRKTLLGHVNYILGKKKLQRKAVLSRFLSTVRDRAALLEKEGSESDCGKAFRELEAGALVGLETVTSIRLLSPEELLVNQDGKPVSEIPGKAKAKKAPKKAPKKVAKVAETVETPSETVETPSL
jgi:hypothetical protein